MEKRTLKALTLYRDAERAASEAAEPHGFPCGEGCAWCCHQPVAVTDTDMLLVGEGIRGLSQAEKVDLSARAQSYVEAMRSRGLTIDLASPAGYNHLARTNPHAFVRAIAPFWPDGGLPCPLLEVDQTTPGRGRCMVYAHRPLVCRLHHAKGPEACRPSIPEQEVQRLDVFGVLQKAADLLRQRPAGVLGVEVHRHLPPIWMAP